MTRRSHAGPRIREPHAAQHPPDDFRTLSVCPTPQEILSAEKPFLRRNVTRGPYAGVDHYLDVQFRLLREDFLRPLREGIAGYRKNSKAGGNRHDPLEARADTSTLRLCTNVLLKEVAIARDELCVSVLLDPNQDNFDNNDKAFMFGSLVLFSRDGFDTMIQATVLDTQLLGNDNGNSRSRNLKVKLINDEDLFAVNFHVYYTMAESVAFFEPYSNVLSALQTMTLGEYPMCQYITGAATTTQPPEYAAKAYVYAADGGVARASSARDWPTAGRLGLNPSQYAAYQGALGREFAIIQGPPGTGKTYLGAKVAQALINGAANSMSPLLVVCATNHALDQFLESLLKITERLVRVGNQSISNKLQPYLLSEQRKHFREMNSGLAAVARATSSKMATLHKKIRTLLPDRKAMNLIAELNGEAAALKACRQAMDLNVLREAKVVGMTTSGAARLRPLLDKLQPRTMIVEEAAEVLEGHIVASLTKHCQHVILIGDHQQLRPITSSHDLTRDYQLDISLFERMLNNGVPCVTLNVQHRMRPEVARLVSPVIYRELKNHASVNGRDNVRGVHKSVFFISHNQHEQETAGKSQSNIHEVTLLVALCRYLILQKYAASKITIIAMYGAQVAKLEAERGKFAELQDVKISTVDGYQGEENDIVLLSLVRSNPSAKIGFLRTINRVCVALSRAKNGLYIVGNMENLTRENNNSLWCRINAVLNKHRSVGTHLHLQCRQHDRMVRVNRADDFDFDNSTKTKCPLKCRDEPPIITKLLASVFPPLESIVQAGNSFLKCCVVVVIGSVVMLVLSQGLDRLGMDF